LLDKAIAVAAQSGRVCLALVFAIAAVHKLRNRKVLQGVVANYRILPRPLAAPAAQGLPWAELALALLLGNGWLAPAAALAGIGLLAVFAWAMAVNLRRGRGHIDCGCGQSVLRQTLGWPLVWRNLALALLLAPSLVAPGLAPQKAADPALLALGAAAGASLFVLYLLFNAISSLTQPGPVAA
jgi:hypothetical protein